MVSQRNRIINLVNYLETLGIIVNIGKNKARGNKGFFKVVNNNYRIDIANNLTEDAILRVLVHEFAHYVHYKNDKSLKSLDFILPNLNDDLHEELISLTVESIPKESIKPLFDIKERLEDELKTTQSSFFNNIKQRQLRSINSKIQRLNRYYNSYTELFARSMEIYVLENDKFSKKAPLLKKLYDSELSKKQNLELSNFIKIFINTI